MKRRIFAAFLALCMMLAMFPGGAVAAERPEDTFAAGDAAEDAAGLEDGAAAADAAPDEDSGAAAADAAPDEDSGAQAVDAAPDEEEVVLLEGSGSLGNGLSWNLSGGTLTINGSGAMTDYAQASAAPWYAGRTEIERIIIGDGVTYIGARAFCDCVAAENITIPNTVTTIGTYAFAGSTAVKNIVIPDTVTSVKERAFSACTGLMSVSLSTNLQELGDYAFYSCSMLQSITVPGSLERIGSNAFYGCASLTKATILEGVKTIGSYSFRNCTRLHDITIPNSVTSIEYYAFGGDTRLSNVYFTGNEVQWNAISIGSENARLTGTRKFFEAAADSTRVVGPANMTWSLANGVLEIAGNGNMIEYGDSTKMPWYAERINIREIVIRPGITAIADNAFVGCTDLDHVTIPETVTSIGSSAFQNCSALQNITLPEKLVRIWDSAFEGCASLMNISIPDTVIGIGERTFYGCKRLQSVTVPGSAGQVKSNTFYGCSSLTKATILDGVNSIGSYAFRNCTRLQDITIPNSVTSIDYYAFGGDTRLRNVYFTGRDVQWNAITVGNENANLTNARKFFNAAPDSTKVENKADVSWDFSDGVLTIRGTGNMIEYGDTSSMPWYNDRMDIFEIVIERGITGIADNAFTGFNGVESVTIPDTVTSIGSAAFKNCTALPNISIPDSVTQIWSDAFYGCVGLETVRQSKNLCYVSSNVFRGCSSLLEIDIPDTVTGIGEHAFNGCRSLQSVCIPGSVGMIGNYAFYNCSALTKVTILDGVNTIGNYAFENCTRLQEITIPKSVTQIYYAFSGCGDLRTVNYTGTEAQWKAISNYNNVPSNAVVNYRHAVSVESIALDASAMTLQVGNSKRLAVTFTPEDTTQRRITWASANSAVATVADGVVTGVAEGQTAITATSQGKQTVSCAVTVTAQPVVNVPVESVSLNKAVLTLAQGAQETLTATVSPSNASNRVVSWSSSDSSVASVNMGIVTGNKAGTATITVTTADGGKTATCQVTVLPVNVPVESVSLNKTSLELAEGAQETLIATVTPSNATNQAVTWSSSDPSVAAVDNNGVVTAGSRAGTATITVTTADGGKTATCQITLPPVIQPGQPTPVFELNKTSLTLQPKQTDKLNPVYTGAVSTQWRSTWASSNTNVVSVDNNGTVTAVATGTANITLTVEGVSKTCAVTVVGVTTLQSIQVTPPTNTTIPVGTPLDLSGMKVVAVYSNGKTEEVTDFTLSAIDVHSVGTKTITVTYKEKTASFTIEVKAKQLLKIWIASLPSKQSYTVGDTFDRTGMQVKAAYDNGEQAVLTNYDVTCDLSKAGTATVTVAYGGCSASFPVTVNPKPAAGSIAAPQISISSGIGYKTVTLSQASGVPIYYTLDGSVPTASSTRYTAPLRLTATATVKAAAIQGGVSSKVTSGRIAVSQVSALAASHASGELAKGTIVTLRTPTSGAMIYYTTNGSAPDPNNADQQYKGSIVVDRDMTIKAVAVKSGYQTSTELSVAYTVPQEEAPSATVSLGSAAAAAGDTVSVPVYIFTEDDMNVTGFRFGVRYAADVFQFDSLTAADGIDQSRLFASAEDGKATLLYLDGNAASGGEMCTLNLKVRESAVDGEYPIEVLSENLSIQLTGSGTADVGVMNGKVTLSGSANSKLAAEIVFTNPDGTAVDTLSGYEGAELQASVSVQELRSQQSIANVILAVYDGRGKLLSSDVWKVDLSDPNLMLLQTIQIPAHAAGGTVKLMILSETMAPLMNAKAI